MATNFFERQDVARRNTKWLVVMFVLAVIGLVGTTIVATTFALSAMHGGEPGNIPLEVPLAAGVGTLVLIGGGSAFKIAQLAGGGTVVAERLGGRRVCPNTTDPIERRLLNVVEEMALASGVPVPPVFLMTDERGINAFAAGFSPSDAVIGVTRGTAQQLTRDQLQGVIAHEFSHLLNGDMRLNLRLMGVLHGILLVGIIGRELLRIGARSGGGSRSREKGGGFYLLLIGLAFIVIGFLGVLFGNIIKAAVSRQREYLADASAVQFTRNPEGIAGALKRIGSAMYGSLITNPRAEEASHMYFATGLSTMFATHPPLEERIRRLDPSWDGVYPPPLPKDTVAGLLGDQAAGLIDADIEYVPLEKIVPQQVVMYAAEQVGQPTENHQEYVQELVATIPYPVTDAAHEPYGARALVFALLLDRRVELRAQQLRTVERLMEKPVYKLTHHLIPFVDDLDVRARLPLVDMSLPALRAMSLPQYQAFAKSFAALVETDQQVGLFEWTLHRILSRHLRSQYDRAPSKVVRYYGLQRLERQCSVLLSTLARASQSNDAVSFDAAAQQVPEIQVRYLPAEKCGLVQLQEALDELAHVEPKQRQRLVDACAAAICADAAVEVAEAELLRGICDMLDCPLPPLLPGQRVAPVSGAW